MSSTKELKVKISVDNKEALKGFKGLANEIKNVTKDTKQFATDVGKGLQDVGKKMTLAGVAIVTGIGGIVAKGAEWSAQVEGQKFLYNNLDKAIQKSIDSNSKNAQAIGLTSQQYKNGATDISTYYKNMGLTSEATAELSGKTMDLVADLGAVKDVPFDEALGDFKSALMGNYEAVDKYGISLSASTLENSEFVKSLGKSWNQLSDNEKMMAAYNEITRQGASAQGLAKQEAESFGMKFKLLKQQISETVGEIGSNLLPVLEPLIQKFSEVATKISEWVKENPKLTQTILIIVGSIGALLTIIGTLTSLVGSAIVMFAGFTIASAVVNGAVLGVIAVIAALVGALIYYCTNTEKVNKFVKDCWNSAWDYIKSVCKTTVENIKATYEGFKSFIIICFNAIKSVISTAWNGIVSAFNMGKSAVSSVIGVFNNIKSSISSAMNSIYSTVSSIWNRVKSIFSAVLKPNIKMPRISISGSFSLNPPSVPKFGISWYSKGAIFKRPTVLGGMGVGDKHNGIGSNAEAILPINQLPKLLGLDKLQNNSGIALNIENFNNNTDKDIEYLANELAFYMRRKNIGMGGAY